MIANFGLTNVAAGTRVNSHFVFFDPLARETLQGTITFDTPVLAAITLRPQFLSTDAPGDHFRVITLASAPCPSPRPGR